MSAVDSGTSELIHCTDPELVPVSWLDCGSGYAAILGQHAVCQQSACRGIDQFTVRLGELSVSVWKIVVLVEADELVDGVKCVSELHL